MPRKKVKLLPESRFRQVYSRVPRLTVDIVIRKKKAIVLVKREQPPCLGFWILPGGTVLLDESLEEAVRRVAKDETGLNVFVKNRLGIIEYSRRAAFGQVVAIVFLADAISGQLRGNKYGRRVEAFAELPTKMISEQKRFLSRFASPNAQDGGRWRDTGVSLRETRTTD